jgi:type VI secretion system lysozyme-like protein
MPFILERLAAVSELYPERQPAFDLQAAVQAQLRRLVSTRPLDADSDDAALLEFGMPSVVELAQDGAIGLERYAQRLQRLIGHFEPRLRQPRVSIAATADRLSPHRLVVTGMLTIAGDTLPVRFDLSDY